MLWPRELIAANADDDSIALLIDCRGTVTFSQAGHEVALERGGGVAILHAEPASMLFPHACYVAVIAPVKACNRSRVRSRTGQDIMSRPPMRRFTTG